jgi:hypothetical protein
MMLKRPESQNTIRVYFFIPVRLGQFTILLVQSWQRGLFIFDPTGSEGVILVNCPTGSLPPSEGGTEVTPSPSGTSQTAGQTLTGRGGNCLPGLTVLPAILTILLVLLYRKRIS